MSDKDFVQGVFWNNFPCKNSKHLRMFDQQVRKTSLRKKQYPYIIFTGTTNIDFKFIINDPVLTADLKQKQALHIYLYEPTSLYVNDGFTQHYYSEFHNKHNENARASELDDIRDLVKKTGLEVIVHTCDYTRTGVLQSYYPEFEVVCDDFFIKSTNNIFRRPIHKDIKKPFWCSNGRYTIHRHLMMSFLANKQGNYSWHFTCYNFDEILNKISWVEQPLPFEKLNAGNEILNHTHFSLDGKPERLNVDDPAKFYLPDHHFINNADYMSTYNSCFCAVINETRFAQPFANISEKTLDAIAVKMPFILVAPPRSLEYTRRLGFKTFSEYWDESYDLEENHSKRMAKIFDVIDYLNSKSINELRDMYNSMSKIIAYNYKKAKLFHRHEIILPS